MLFDRNYYKKIKNNKSKKSDRLDYYIRVLEERYSICESLKCEKIKFWLSELKKIKNKKSPLANLLLDEIEKEFQMNDDFFDFMNDLEKCSIPNEIKSEVLLDFNEAIKSFKAENYRAAIMLCARVLETSLFRKYYDLTGKDLLETSPGYGLGKLVAELRKLNQIDPGIMQQIHIVNQIRIYSVHKKKETFIPSREQTQAILLYTYDLIKKLYP